MFALYLLLLAGTLLYLYQRYAFSYWSRNYFPSIEPSFPFGNLLDVVLRRSSIGIHLYNLYKKTTDPLLVGIYVFLKPALLIKDAKLVRRILTQDFNHFHDRGTYHNAKVDPMSGHMFNMEGSEWRNMRAKLTSSFTSGKLRSMLPMILKEGETLKNYLTPRAKLGEVVKMKELLDRYSLNIIASVGFGLDVDTITNPDHEFLKIEQIVTGPGLINTARLAFAFLCPGVLNFFGTHANCEEARDYFIDMTTKTFEYRERNNVERKDFVQLLLQLRNSGEVGADGDWTIRKKASDAEAKSDAGNKLLTIEQCAAQLYLFYLAGFDTSSSALAFTLFELVRNPLLLKKLQREIDETLERHNNEITYDAIAEMKYMEMCINESVRKYPTLPMLNRICTEDYKVPDTELIIRKGTPIFISVIGLSRDAKYFPEPESYDPERFAEGPKSHDENAFIPFGDGPRNCIGLRLGKMVAKIGLVQLLRSYDFECVNDAEIEFHNFSVTLAPMGGVEIRVVERK